MGFVYTVTTGSLSFKQTKTIYRGVCLTLTLPLHGEGSEISDGICNFPIFETVLLRAHL